MGHTPPWPDGRSLTPVQSKVVLSRACKILFCIVNYTIYRLWFEIVTVTKSQMGSLLKTA
jgi:hypothetical protein